MSCGRFAHTQMNKAQLKSLNGHYVRLQPAARGSQEKGASDVVFLLLAATRTTVTVQSFMGAIMAIGVDVANAILLVTFAEQTRRHGGSPLPVRRPGPSLFVPSGSVATTAG